MTTTTVFRYKLCETIMLLLADFAQIHAHDDRHMYRDAWNLWCEKNEEAIKNETERLKSIGYDGDVEDKMYKAGRYYFRDKKNILATPKSRRKYISMSRKLVNAMDMHITRHIGMPPATGYSQFCFDNTEILYDEIVRLLQEEKLVANEIQLKIKKTYKNRYFLQQE